MTDLEAAVAEAGSILEELALPYMLIGALAVSAWGEARATLDVDFAAETRVLPMLSCQGIRLDLLFAALPAERDMIARAHTRQLGGRPIRIAAVEDLIWMKLISERPKDMEDAMRLLRRFRGTLDRAYLEPKLRELSEAFARQDILDIFRREMERP